MWSRFRFGCGLVAVVVALWLGTGDRLAVFGYNPPVDSANGVTLRIEGPSEWDTSAEPFSVTLVVENSRAEAIQGRIRIGLIDGFACEPPSPIEITVPAQKQVRKELRIRAGERVFNANYPIHARGRFVIGSDSLELHPILIVLVKNAPPPRTASWDWNPIAIPNRGHLALEEIPVSRAVFQVFGQASEVMPVGWHGSHPVHRGTVHVSRRTLGGVTKAGITMHPPWYEGKVGTALLEWPVQLPDARPIRLQFALGMQTEGNSDGVTFRVRVVNAQAKPGELGQVIFERHTTAQSWEEHTVDMSQLAGQSVRLQLESHPGPKNNTGWDSSFWAEPTLIVGEPGGQSPAATGMAGQTLQLGTVNLGKQTVRYEARLGSRGLLDGEILFHLDQKTASVKGLQVTVLGCRIDRERSSMILVEVKPELEKLADGSARLTVHHIFQGFAGSFDLVTRLAEENGALTLKTWLENVPPPRPWIHWHLEDVAVGVWSEQPLRIYAGPGNVVQKPEAYTLGFDGHRLSTSFVGLEFPQGLSIVQACDVPPTSFEVNPASRHDSIHAASDCRFTFVAAETPWEAVKLWRGINGLKAASGVQALAGRFVFDLWGGRYRESADALQKAFAYGLTDSLVIWHNWQRWGYDYRLPEIYPPNPQLGTLEDMQYLAKTCRDAGVRFALHDNYIDFYPDAEGFSYLNTIAFHQNGQPVRAWLNEGRQAQSYRYRADQVEPFLQANLKAIAQNIAPTAYFIDVWSSIGPYDYWTADGKFFDRVYTRNTWGRLFAWIRELLGDNAPQISESGHDQLIGWLDGATTNHLRVGNPQPGYYRWSVWDWSCEDAERIPWFDSAHHDRFALHGAGYSGRYQAGLNARLHGIYSDDYITTEVMTGHPAMVSEAFGADVVRKYWLLAPLGRALALDRIDHVEFVGGNLHRIHVRWESGAAVWCNRGESDWEVEGHTLPQYGFVARAPVQRSQASSTQSSDGQVLAAISRRNGIITECTSTPDSFYVNGRKDYAGPVRIRPLAKRFSSEGRRLEVEILWSAPEGLPKGFVPFAHFCDDAGEIVFQGGFRGFPAPDQAVPKEFSTLVQGSVPDTVREATRLELRIGLYRPQDGRRLSLSGPDDGDLRIRLGTLSVLENANLSWEAIPDAPDPVLARKNPEGLPIDFGGVITAQAVRVTRGPKFLLVTALPVENKATTAELVWDRLPWRLPPPQRVEYCDLDGQVLQAAQVSNQQRIAVEIVPPAVACRISWE